MINDERARIGAEILSITHELNAPDLDVVDRIHLENRLGAKFEELTRLDQAVESMTRAKYGFAEKDTAKALLVILEKEFPNEKFSLEPHSYSPGYVSPHPPDSRMVRPGIGWVWNRVIDTDPPSEQVRRVLEERDFYARTWGVVRYVPYEGKKMPWRCTGFVDFLEPAYNKFLSSVPKEEPKQPLPNVFGDDWPFPKLY
jgi:hypothetical protein